MMCRLRKARFPSLHTVNLAILLSCAILSMGCGQESDSGALAGEVEVIARNLAVPWALDFLPGGDLVFTERSGAVKRMVDGVPQTIGQIAVTASGESGLLGIAVDPAFAQSGRVYLYYTSGTVNRVSRFTLSDILTNEEILLDAIPAASTHNGGRIHFGPDGLLYITTGDAGVVSRSRDTSSLGGKILRMNPDGSIPAGNPFGNYIYALGLRNPQGLAWRNEELYATDHGPTRLDRIVRIERGADYGWPQTCAEIPAFKCYDEFTLAPSGAAIVGNTLYVAGLRGEQLRAIDLASGTEEVLLTEYGRLRAVVAHEGFLFVTTSNRDGRGDPASEDDRILRIPVNSLR